MVGFPKTQTSSSSRSHASSPGTRASGAEAARMRTTEAVTLTAGCPQLSRHTWPTLRQPKMSATTRVPRSLVAMPKQLMTAQRRRRALLRLRQSNRLFTCHTRARLAAWEAVVR